MKFYKHIIITLLLSLISLNAQTLRVEVNELLLNPNKYKVIDARKKSEYLDYHIKNALNFPADLTYEQKKQDGKIVQAATMQEITRKLGLNISDNIIIYDEGVFFDAARLFWALEVYGFKNVKLLNGGIKQWKQNCLETTKVIPKVKRSKYITSVNNNRIATKFSTQIATKNPNQIILDARAIEAYNGESSIAKRFGHIPTAEHFSATQNIDYSKDIIKLKSENNLQKLYSKLNTKNKVIVYCAMGKIASLNYFALRELDYNVANYDASWKEWGNDFSLPIINPSQK
ncbi:MAG: sulfurtransferase [Sulfurimonas sp.]|uniref:sulfurtransferase n=1 Tax=Sulfurimonas sp. TaxID=2022749 RepID=UPI003D09DE3A